MPQRRVLIVDDALFMRNTLRDIFTSAGTGSALAQRIERFIDYQAIAVATPVTLTWDNGQGLLFTRTINVDQDYMFTVRDSVRNSSAAPVKLLTYGLISRTGTPEVAGYYILFEGLLGVVDGRLQETNYSNAKSEGEKKNPNHEHSAHAAYNVN